MFLTDVRVHENMGIRTLFFLIRRLGPSIYRTPKKYQEFQAPPKTYLKFK